MVYFEVYGMVYEPERYIGKTVKMRSLWDEGKPHKMPCGRAVFEKENDPAYGIIKISSGSKGVRV